MTGIGKTQVAVGYVYIQFLQRNKYEDEAKSLEHYLRN